jgi:large subunit ribosomal protein L17
MRHGKKFNHLSRKSAHRKAMLSNMACSLIEHKRIKTTLAKAKALRVYIEPLITKSKNDTTHSRRIAFSYLKQKEAITELFSDIAIKVSDRQGGYTRILKLSNRLGDNAQMALIELVDYNEEYTTNKPKKSKSRRTRKKNLDQSTITESNKDNIIEDVTSSEIRDVASSEKVEENIVEKKSSDVKDESNIKIEKEVTDAENKEEKGE